MTKTRKRSGRRTVGRPTAEAGADVRAALIAAAKQLFLKHGFQKVTARQIAATAGTTPAMIHYYFDNKLGLFRAMLHDAIAPFVRMLGDSVATPGDSSVDLGGLIGAHTRLAAANDWIVSLIVHEVLPEGGKFRSTFVREIASKLLPMLSMLVERGKREGKLRKDLDANLTALSIISLNVFPLISRPITAPLLGLKLQGTDLERLIEHTTTLLLRGIAVSSREARHEATV